MITFSIDPQPPPPPAPDPLTLGVVEGEGVTVFCNSFSITKKRIHIPLGTVVFRFSKIYSFVPSYVFKTELKSDVLLLTYTKHPCLQRKHTFTRKKIFCSEVIQQFLSRN